MSNGLDPDQYRNSVGPGLSLNRLQRLSEDDKKLSLTRKELKNGQAQENKLVLFSFIFKIFRPPKKN